MPFPSLWLVTGDVSMVISASPIDGSFGPIPWDLAKTQNCPLYNYFSFINRTNKEMQISCLASNGLMDGGPFPRYVCRLAYNLWQQVVMRSDKFWKKLSRNFKHNWQSTKDPNLFLAITAASQGVSCSDRYGSRDVCWNFPVIDVPQSRPWTKDSDCKAQTGLRTPTAGYTTR